MKDRKLSAAQLSMLRSIRDHGDPWAKIRGQSAHGGAHGTLVSLTRRGLIEFDDGGHGGWEATAAGISALKTA